MAGRQYHQVPPAHVPVAVYRRPPPQQANGYGGSFASGQGAGYSAGYGGGYGGSYVGGHTGNAEPGSTHFEDGSPSNSGPMPSTKAQNLANDIEGLESKCNHLEERNTWLTKKLLYTHKRFIEKTLLGNSQGRLRRCLEAWREAMQELTLERQLDEQSASLDQCQRVAKELGEALGQEQEAHKTSEGTHKRLQDDLQRAILQEKRLKQQYKDQQAQLEILESRVQEAETCLARSRQDAQAVVESAMDYERRRHEIESADAPLVREDSYRRRPQSPLENSIRTREEANGVMQKVSGFLQRPSISSDY